MNHQKRLGIYLPVLLIAIIATVTLRTLACVLHLDFESGYFTSKTLINTSSFILVGSALFLFTHLFFSEHGKKLIASFSGPETYVPTGAISAALAFFAAHSFERAMLRGYSISELLSFEHGAQAKALAILEFTLAICALLSIAHFVLTAMITEKMSNARAGYGITAVVFFALYASYLYFSTELPINAPNKLVDQMAYLLTAIFFLYEIRISLGRELWPAYRAFGLIAALLSAYSAIPSLLVYFITGKTVSASIYENAVMLTVFIFIISRLVLASRLGEDRESELVLLVRHYTDSKSAEIESRELLAMAAHTLEEGDEPLGEEEADAQMNEDGGETEDAPSDEYEPIQLTFDSEDGNI